MKLLTISISCLLAAGCADAFECRHNNSEPTYGEETGLPKNCRALVQANIDGYRSGQYTVDEVMASLERNCGANGYNWDE